MEKGDFIPIKLNRKNYINWSFHLKHFAEGQGLVSQVHRWDWSLLKKNPLLLGVKITLVMWILNSVEPSMGLSLQSDMLNHFHKFYHQTNKAREFLVVYWTSQVLPRGQDSPRVFPGFLTSWNEKGLWSLTLYPQTPFLI